MARFVVSFNNCLWRKNREECIAELSFYFYLFFSFLGWPLSCNFTQFERVEKSDVYSYHRRALCQTVPH